MSEMYVMLNPARYFVRPVSVSESYMSVTIGLPPIDQFI